MLLECQRAHIFEGEDTEAKGFGFQHARRRRESPEVSGVDVANNQLESQRAHFACALLFTVCADAVLLSSGRDTPKEKASERAGSSSKGQSLTAVSIVWK